MTLASLRERMSHRSQLLEFVETPLRQVELYRRSHYHQHQFFFGKSIYSPRPFGREVIPPSSKLDFHTWIPSRISWLLTICWNPGSSSLLHTSQGHYFHQP